MHEIVEGLKDFSISCENGCPLASVGIIFGLFGLDALVLEELAVETCEIVEDNLLLVICLKEAVLVRAILFEFRGKEMRFVVCNGFFIED